MSAGDGDPIVVASQPVARSMAAYLLSDDRQQPAIALTQSETAVDPVLAPRDVRAIVGSGPRIYLLTLGYLRTLETVLGPRLALGPGTARIWWPGLSRRSRPAEHPLVFPVNHVPAPEYYEMLAEFVRWFDLSRPVVRREIEVIEQACAFAEHELEQAREENARLQGENARLQDRLHDTLLVRHRERVRADAAELRRALQPPQRALPSAAWLADSPDSDATGEPGAES